MKDRAPENTSYDQHARNCAPDDLWGQVRRTVNGRPLPEEQIDMIVEQVVALLELGPQDALLDLCCGNGALSSRWFSLCATGLGIDASEFLIDVAKQRFAREGACFEQHEALSFVLETGSTELFTRAVCYGSLQYFSQERALRLLTGLGCRFPRLTHVVIGNVPDMDRLTNFYGDCVPTATELASPLTALGVWHTERAFARLASNAGWDCSIHTMPIDFHAAHYRFDALLTRKQRS